MTTKVAAKPSAFIRDDELRDAFGLAAELIIDALDRDPFTQKGQGTVPFDARPRETVERWLAQRGYTL